MNGHSFFYKAHIYIVIHRVIHRSIISYAKFAYHTLVQYRYLHSHRPTKILASYK